MNEMWNDQSTGLPSGDVAGDKAKIVNLTAMVETMALREKLLQSKIIALENQLEKVRNDMSAHYVEIVHAERRRLNKRIDQLKEHEEKHDQELQSYRKAIAELYQRYIED